MLTGNLLPAHPHPKHDELFSSWLTRIAMSNGIKLYTLGKAVFGSGTGIWNRDIDKSVTNETIDCLCAKTGISQSQIYATTLRSYEGVLYAHHNPNGNTKWILPAGVYHRTRRRNWLVYCPLCLFEDTTPYFRKSWRLAFHTVCDKHDSMMHDACPTCNTPVVFFRRELGHRSTLAIDSLILCHQCGFDLRRAGAFSPLAPDAQSFIALRSLIGLRDIGWWFCGEETFNYSMQYLDVLHYIATFMTSIIGKRLLVYVEHEAGYIRMSDKQLPRLPIEFRPLNDRHWLILCTLWLLDEWPNRFIKACRKTGLTVSRVTRSEQLPYWFERVMRL